MKRAVLIASLLTTVALYLSAQTITRGAATPAQAPAPAPGIPGPANPAPVTAARPPAALTNGLIGQARIGTNQIISAHSNITPVQMQNINLLDQEMARLPIPGANATETRRQLLETLQAAPVAKVQPSPESIVGLGTTLASVVPTLGLTAPQRRQFAIDLNLVLNNGNLSPLQAERVIIDVRTLLQTRLASNPRGVETLLGDLSSMVGQVQGQIAAAGSVSAAAAVAAEDRREQASPPAHVGQGVTSQAGQGSGASQPTNPAVPVR